MVEQLMVAGERRAALSGATFDVTDPATGQAWSGRGLHPKWLKQAIAGGAKITDFLV